MIRISIVFTVLAAVLLAGTAETEARRLNISDEVPNFSVVDNEGIKITYPNVDKPALLVAFLSLSKPQSVKAVSDLEEMIGSIEKNPNKLTVLIVLDDPNSVSTVNLTKSISNAQIQKHLVVDRDYKLWGTFGAIASPTVFLAGVDNKIMLVKAGYGYDFAPAIKSKLLMAVGLTSEDTFSSEGGVKTVSNKSVSGKVARHLKMAKMLEQKQKYESALKQLELAVGIDPNSMEGLLELGRLYCIVSEPQKAINLVEKMNLKQKEQQALRCFILGRGYFLMKKYDSAEKYLLESLQLNSRSSEVYYFLGRVYHIQNKDSKAIEAYYQSLFLLYGNNG